jgi:redox-sensitive bicupin YhaK (pirin superfamily)
MSEVGNGMNVSTLTPARSVDRVTTKQRLGADAQVDDKALIIVPSDPALTDPFLLLAEDWFSEPGFEWHPHRGLETVTTVLDGVLEHGDNLGNVGALEPGDVQWMTAGRGIIHRELAFRNEHVHTLQLWLNLPARSKLAATQYQDVLAAGRPRVTLPGAVIDVVSGNVFGVRGPARNHQPVQGAMVTLEPGAVLDYVLPASHRAFVHVLSGELRVAGRALHADQTAWSDPAKRVGDSRLLLEAVDPDEPVKLMIYSGEPIREPVAFGGPFVMNKRSEIDQAFADFHAGKFGQVPRQQRLKRRRG